MTPENTEKLFTAFPKLYRGKNKPRNLSLMCYGFDCGDGWFQLIWDLSEKLEPLDIEAMQVKEKFGGLRFYTGPANDKVWDLIDKAETLSLVTCEMCGTDKDVTTEGGWIKTLCPPCRTERNRLI